MFKQKPLLCFLFIMRISVSYQAFDRDSIIQQNIEIIDLINRG